MVTTTSKSPKSTKAQPNAREAARAQVTAMREAQAKRERRTRNITIGALAGVILVLVVAFVFVMRHNSISTALGDEVPAIAGDQGGYSFGADGKAGTSNSGAPVLDVYADYMCPICQQFESANFDNIDAARMAGDVTLVIHPVAILDSYSMGTQYSTRSAAAFALVATEAPEAALAFNAALYDNQPGENTSGLSNTKLGDLAKQAGVPDSVANEISAGKAVNRFGGWVQTITAQVVTDSSLIGPNASAFGTPAIKLAGQLFTENWQDPSALQTAITAAKNG
jgi:protein-disulfide isomerase